ncbi:MAG: polysaccharide biosynthesis protein [Flavobacteriales bacterium]|nr:MAG: polysaccharide biosynthesis protein [Flavobacteriales bacterium]
MKKLLSETIIYGIGAILPRVITFLLNPYYIDQIDREEYAQFANLYAWIAFVNVVLSFGFETSFFRFSADKGREKKVFNTSFWYLFGTASVFLLGILIFNNFVAEAIGYGEYPHFIRWFAWIAFFDTLCIIPFAWLRFHNRPIRYSAVRVIQILVQTLVVLALFNFVPTDFSASLGAETKVSYPFFSNLIGSFLGAILLLPIILKVRFHFSKTLFVEMLKYSFPIMLAGLAFMVNENFDKLTQFYVISKGDSGAYGGCYKLAVLMTLFVTAYRMGVEPFFFKQMKNENAKITYAKVTEYFTLFASAVAMGIIANIAWLKTLFIRDESYWVAIDIVPAIIIANLCFGIYYNLSTWYKVTDRTIMGTYISWAGALITIALHWFLLPKFGLMVSAWTTLVAYFTMMMLSYFLGQKYYPIPYDIKKIGFSFLGLVIFSFISYQLFNANIWVGNILFIIFVGLILFSEKEFILKKVLKR